MRYWFPYSAVIALFLASTQAASAGQVFPKVLVVVNPLAPYANEILHGVGNAQNLLRPGQEPHSFTLAPSQARMLAEAEILITPDRSINPVLDRLASRQKKLRVIELSKLNGADPLPYAKENPWVTRVKELGKSDGDDDHDHGHDHDHDHGHEQKTLGKPLKAQPVATTDPHFWLDPERMAAIAVPLAEAIAQSAPEHKATLTANAKALASQLRDDVKPAIAELLKAKAASPYTTPKPQIPFITYHAAYGYFLQRFSITDDGAITIRPEDYMGAKTLNDLLNAATKVYIRCVIAEEDSPLVKRVAKASGAKIVILSPEQQVDENDVPPLDWVKNGYDRLLYKTAKSFSECL